MPATTQMFYPHVFPEKILTWRNRRIRCGSCDLRCRSCDLRCRSCDLRCKSCDHRCRWCVFSCRSCDIAGHVTSPVPLPWDHHIPTWLQTRPCLINVKPQKTRDAGPSSAMPYQHQLDIGSACRVAGRLAKYLSNVCHPQQNKLNMLK